jgi:hypothetical protein
MAARRDPVVVYGRGVMAWEEVRLASGGLTTFGITALTRQDAMAQGKAFGENNTHMQEQDRLFHEFADAGGAEMLNHVTLYARAHRTYLISIVARANGSPSAGDVGSEFLPALSQRPGQGSIGIAAVGAGRFGLRRMRLFMTEEGWLGKGPESMTAGDEIWIVPGGEVAFVLRSRRANFSYVGHAYVHGIMDGEECSRRFSGVPMTEITWCRGAVVGGYSTMSSRIGWRCEVTAPACAS